MASFNRLLVLAVAAALAAAAAGTQPVRAGEAFERPDVAADVAVDPAAAADEGSEQRQQGAYVIPNSGYPGYGEVSGSDDFPSVLERMQMCWYNYVRMDPQAFKALMPFQNPSDGDTTLINGGEFGPTSGIYWDLNLNRAARAHGVDLQANCGGALQHNSCNGTGAGTRVRTFSSTYNGEILWSYGGWGGTQLHKALLAPFAMISGWICDGPMYGSGMVTDCCDDGASCDGHRSNIMTVGSRAGCGIEINPSDGRCTNTCNQGGGTSPYAGRKIVSASHVFSYPASTTAMGMRYMLNWWNNGNAPNAAPQVFINGQATTMTLEAMGTYTTPEVTIAPGQGAGLCDEYYFMVDGERYPETGVLTTYGVESCVENWRQSSGTPNPPPPSSPAPSSPASSSPAPSSPLPGGGTVIDDSGAASLAAPTAAAVAATVVAGAVMA